MKEEQRREAPCKVCILQVIGGLTHDGRYRLFLQAKSVPVALPVGSVDKVVMFVTVLSWKD